MPDTPRPARAPTLDPTLDDVHRWWRAANYLAVGQIYLLDNPLLVEPLGIDHVKPRLLGHWGTTPGLNLLWAHVNRLIVARDLSAMFVCGPGHGGPAAVANPWLEGRYGELYPDVGWSVDGMRRLFRQFSFPGGIPSHAAPETPGSIHEGGELGYALAHAYGAAFDAPGELVVCTVGDGEAETGALAASWHSHRFVNPARDGVVLPVLHLNGWKIANPTVLSRVPESTLRRLFEGYGHESWFVEGDEPGAVHEALAAALDGIADRHAEIRDAAVRRGRVTNVRWPMLVLRTPKGWTGPHEIDGEPVEGHFRAHQVPIGHDLGPERLVAELERWMRSYGPDELFTADGAPAPSLDALRPAGERRMSANPRTDGGRVAVPLELPDAAAHAVTVGAAGEPRVGATGVAGGWLRDVIAANPDNFLLFGPDEIASNRLSAAFDVTGRRWLLERNDEDVHLDPEGRVFEILSEHLCQGWLEGYTLTGRHGLFTSYEAFVHVVDSMFNQHAKWLESSARVTWRAPLPSFTYLLSSHVWRQDHNGFSHQDPGFLDVAANKRADVVRIYLPPDANCLLATLERCLGGRHRINVVVAGKQPEPQYLGMAEARAHLEAGLGTWDWAGSEPGADGGSAGAAPDVVLCGIGDVPTMETLAAAELLRARTSLSARVVNVVDLMALQSPDTHPHGAPDARYDACLPPGVPTIVAFHGYPQLVHRLAHERANRADLHVHGFMEEGTTTTPFDMAVANGIDRFHLALDAIARQPDPDREDLAAATAHCEARLAAHRTHVREAGDELPEIRGWTFVRPDAPDGGSPS